MNKDIKVLIVDDHPMIIEGYKNALLGINSDEMTLRIDTADSCDGAYTKIKNSSTGTPYDVIFLDIKLPPSADGKIISGEDLGIKVKELLPDTKVVILTMFNNNFRIHNILKNINPDGFLVKSDVTSDELMRAFQVVLTDPPYYSHTVTKLLRTRIINEVVLDDIDRNILFHLSKGIKTKNLTEYIPLSLAAIEKRKRHLKEVFDVEKKGDESLLEQARNTGFL
ncbi:Oxygen regulatory protein NreC [Kordia antarctica]|uniref:Oxygen regulatory protein NreC n=1 Tax=Kordia antarctica TaxID=1218801 RepID=A0A7L4ZF18_9FLAO|nr:response regulator [Kordia antarctica]QHI35205.1 Oxygen regulatory protein NreC [Kordia antarctica]